MQFPIINNIDPANTALYETVFVIFAIICMIVPYLLGSLNFAVIISKIFYHDDIRNHGSGNAGTTNMLRTYGKGAAAATLILDMSKCVVSVLIGNLLINYTGIWIPDGNFTVVQFHAGYLAGLFCIIGHIFPCFYKFRGGKGVASVAMFALCTEPIVFLILLAIFIIIVVGTKFVSLGSVMCMLLYPIFLNAIGTQRGFTIIIAFIISALIIFMHRENIKRIYHGKESKISFSKKKKVENPEENNEK